MKNYVIYFKDTGEIRQTGYMDDEAFSVHPVQDGQEMIEVPKEEAWKLRGEFRDSVAKKHNVIVDTKTKKLKTRPGKSMPVTDPLINRKKPKKLR